MHNLADTLRELGELEAARNLQEKVFGVRRRIFGAEHIETVSSMHNLALMFHELGELEEARKLQVVVLEAWERLLGPDHPNTLTAMNNHADTLRAPVDLKATRELQETVLEKRERLLGPEHPAPTSAAWNLYRTLVDFGEASPAAALSNQHLRWILSRDPATLGAVQRTVHGYVAQVLRA